MSISITVSQGSEDIDPFVCLIIMRGPPHCLKCSPKMQLSAVHKHIKVHQTGEKLGCIDNILRQLDGFSI